MKNRGFKDVYQMDGGIVKYGEKYGDDGHWEGSLYIFDDRMGMEFSDHAAVHWRVYSLRWQNQQLRKLRLSKLQ